MTERKYSGWRGVTDPLHILLAVSYEPIDGTLACRMCSGDPIIHVNVPEAKYQTLIHSPFGGAFYRKYIRPKYPLLPGTEPQKSALKPDRKAIRAKELLLRKAEREEQAAALRASSPQAHLF